MTVTYRILLPILVLGINLGTVVSIPKITTPEDTEYVVKSGEDFVLRCEGDVPVTWSYPPANQTTGQLTSSASNIEVQTDKTGDVYVSSLEITKISATNVGFYYCNETDHPSNYTFMYLYVDDDNVLAVDERLLIVVSGKQYSPLVIPCRPTSPLVDVKLYSGVGTDDSNERWESIPLGLNEDGSVWKFDPRIGFVWVVPTEQASSIIFCSFRKYPQRLQIRVLTIIAKPKEDNGVDDTSPREYVFSIKLTSYRGKPLSLLTFLPASIATYDPKIGFVLNTPKNSTLPHYTCKMTKGTEFFEVLVIVGMSQVFSLIHQPLITQLEDKVYNIEHEDLQLKCEVEVEAEQSAKFKWKFNGIDVEKNTKYDIYHNSTKTSETYPFSILTVRDISQKTDQGNYTCHVTDDDNTAENSFEVSILEKDSKFLRLSESNGIYHTDCFQRCDKIVWNIKIESYPPAKITWYNNRNKSISQSARYTINTTNRETILIINNVNISDRGYYTIKASNRLVPETNFRVFLNVQGKPTVAIVQDQFHLDGAKDAVQCKVFGYPPPEIHWEFKSCTDDSCQFRPINSTRLYGELPYISSIAVKSNQSGYVKCYATNEFGTHEQIAPYTVTDVKEGFKVMIVEDDVEMSYTKGQKVSLALEDRITFQCIAASQNYSKEIAWYVNDKPISAADEYTLESSSTVYSTKLSFTISKLDDRHAGRYRCQTLETSTRRDKFIEITVEVRIPERPRIVKTNMNNTEQHLIYPNKHDFSCKYEGVPKPSITWFKDDVEFYPDNDRIKYRDNKQILQFTKTDPTDAGKYTCKVKNRIDSAHRSATMTFSNTTNDSYLKLYIILAIFILISIAVGIGLMIKIRKERELEKMLRQAGLANFEKGAVESINPDLGIDDQAELLPYDKESWEIPRDQMKLGKQLGAGAFGVVMKAVIERYIDNETSLTVAVKMVKKTADDSYLRALASELKIMVHLGKHLNVVNLIGACTKHIAKRELYVVVEYCRFGNLHNYLLRHRENFINQVDPVTGKIDYNIGVEVLSRSFSISSNHSQEGPPKDMQDYRNNSNCNGVIQTTEVTLVSMSPSGSQGDEPLMSNNSVQPEWRSNYKGDYKGNVKPICTKDLLSWAFQVSRGMEYLSSRKVLHGDLAARNILLADNNVVKICDFGLAKSMYKSDNYKKKGDGPLPIKWMAVESIRDKVFSTQSDVWSFGIVLWEFFSLARTPYPGMEADERLFQKLVDGYRMDSPTYATKEIYTMMLNCWEPKPLNRPSFAKLSERIGSMLEDSVRKHYIDLNDPYLVMNTEKFQNGHSDYLQMVSPPDFEKLSSPHYVNDLPPAPNTAQSDYMPMKPGHIFSPREPDGEVFTFSQLNAKDAHSPEMAPMLRHDSDYETQPNTPMTPSYANPSYNKIDFLKGKTIIVNGPDNYVNIPKNKSAIKGEKDGFANDDLHYVNNVSRDWGKV